MEVQESLVVGASSVQRPRETPQWVTALPNSMSAPYRYLARSASQGADTYDPLQETPEMSAALALLDLTEDAIAEFVLRYGWLGVREEWTRLATDDEDPDWRVRGASQLDRQKKEGTAYKEREPSPGIGERLVMWEEVLRPYRALWGAVNGKPEVGSLCLEVHPERDTDEDGRVWQDVAWWLADGKGQIVKTSHNPPYPDWTDPVQVFFRDPEKPPRVVGDTVPWPQTRGALRLPSYKDEKRLMVKARDRALAEALRQPLREGIGAEIVVQDGMALRFKPKSLLAAAYLQIAQDLEAAEHPEYPRCIACDWVYRRRTEDQKTCGDPKCRQRVYMQRMEQARDLADGGMDYKAVAANVLEIAEEDVTSREVAQVEKWVARSRKRRKGPKGGRHG